jgi:hypothetical protein
LLIRGEVTAGQPRDLEPQLAQPFLREVDLAMLKRIFVTSADKEWELIAISLEEGVEVEPIALRFVISDEACCCGEVEQAIMPVQGPVKLAELGVPHVIAFGPHLPNAWHPLEQREGAPHAPASPGGEAAQHRRGVPRVGVPIRKEPAIEDENAPYIRPSCGFAPL